MDKRVGEEESQESLKGSNLVDVAAFAKTLWNAMMKSICRTGGISWPFGWLLAILCSRLKS